MLDMGQDLGVRSMNEKIGIVGPFRLPWNCKLEVISVVILDLGDFVFTIHVYNGDDLITRARWSCLRVELLLVA